MQLRVLPTSIFLVAANWRLGSPDNRVTALSQTTTVTKNHEVRRLESEPLMSSPKLHEEEAMSELDHTFGGPDEEEPRENVDGREKPLKYGVRGSLPQNTNAGYFELTSTASSESSSSADSKKGKQKKEYSPSSKKGKSVAASSELDEDYEDEDENDIDYYGSENTEYPADSPVSQESRDPALSATSAPIMDNDERGRNSGDNVTTSSNLQEGDDVENEGDSIEKTNAPQPDSLELPLAAFKYFTTARWNLTQRDESQLYDVTRKLFDGVYNELYGDEINSVDVSSYSKLAPRVFQFAVTAHFKDSTTMPSPVSMANSIANALQRGKPHNLRYLGMIRSLDSTIFETSIAVRYISDEDALTRAIMNEDGEDDRDGENEHGRRWFVLVLIVAAGFVLLLLCLVFYCYNRSRRTRTAPDFSDTDSTNLKLSKRMKYSTAAFSKDGIKSAGSFTSYYSNSYLTAKNRTTTGETDLEEVPLFDDQNTRNISFRGTSKNIGPPIKIKPPRHTSTRSQRNVAEYRNELPVSKKTVESERSQRNVADYQNELPVNKKMVENETRMNRNPDEIEERLSYLEQEAGLKGREMVQSGSIAMYSEQDLPRFEEKVEDREPGKVDSRPKERPSEQTPVSVNRPIKWESNDAQSRAKDAPMESKRVKPKPSALQVKPPASAKNGGNQIESSMTPSKPTVSQNKPVLPPTDTKVKKAEPEQIQPRTATLNAKSSQIHAGVASAAPMDSQNEAKFPANNEILLSDSVAQNNVTARNQLSFDERSESSTLSESRSGFFDSEAKTSTHRNLTTIDSAANNARKIVSPPSSYSQKYDEIDEDEDYDSLPSVRDRMAMLSANMSQRSNVDGRDSHGGSGKSNAKIPDVVGVQGKSKVPYGRHIPPSSPGSRGRAESNVLSKSRGFVPQSPSSSSISSRRSAYESPKQNSVSNPAYRSPRLRSSSISASERSRGSNQSYQQQQHGIRSRSASPARYQLASPPVVGDKKPAVPEWMKKFQEMGLERSEN